MAKFRLSPPFDKWRPPKRLAAASKPNLEELGAQLAAVALAINCPGSFGRLTIVDAPVPWNHGKTRRASEKSRPWPLIPCWGTRRSPSAAPSTSLSAHTKTNFVQSAARVFSEPGNRASMRDKSSPGHEGLRYRKLSEVPITAHSDSFVLLRPRGILPQNFPRRFTERTVVLLSSLYTLIPKGLFFGSLRFISGYVQIYIYSRVVRALFRTLQLIRESKKRRLVLNMVRDKIYEYDSSDSDSFIKEDSYRRKIRVHRRPIEKSRFVHVTEKGRERASSVSRMDPKIYIDINNEQIRRSSPSPERGRARSYSRQRKSEWDSVEQSILKDQHDFLTRQKIKEEVRRECEKEKERQRKEVQDAQRLDLETQIQIQRMKLDELINGKHRDNPSREEEEKYRYRKKQLDELFRETEKHKLELEKEREVERQREYERQRNWDREWARMLREDRSWSRERRDQCWTREEIQNELSHEELRRIKQDQANKRHVEDAFLVARAQAMEEEKKAKEHEDKIRAKIKAEQDKADAERLERANYEKKLREDAIAEFQKREAEKELKRREAEKKAEKEFNERLSKMLCEFGTTEAEMKDFLHHSKKECKEVTEIKEVKEVTEIVPAGGSNSHCMKVHRRFIGPASLDAYGLPWEWDPYDADYILVNCFVPHQLQEELFEHSRRQRETQLITAGPAVPDEFIEMRVNDKKRDKFYLVRKKPKKTVLVPR
ncbi:hypothetical protein LOZ58_002849 [Ophidiomyces ophidiicola]|nr:hypothetical protein LOZ58_002849 [Ophidiomyces ophidiicola]